MNTKAYKKFATASLFLLAAILLLVPQTAQANAFFVQELSGSSVAQGGAVIAAGSHPSNQFANPAGIAYLEGLQLEAGSTIYIPRGYFVDTEDNRTDMGKTPILIYHLFGSYKPLSWLSVGLATFTEFGLEVNWPDEWLGNHLAQYGGLKSLTINPNIAFGPFHGFTIAAGFDAKWGAIRIKRKLTLGMTPSGDDAPNTVELGGTTWGFGGNLGLMYQPADWVRIGMAYRSLIRMKLSGAEADFDVSEPFAPNFPDQKWSSSIDLPHLLNAGVRFWPMETLSIELDAWYTMWSSYDRLDFEFEEGLKAAPNDITYTQSEQKDFFNGWQVRLGLEWWFHKWFALRAGIMWDGNVVPDDTLDPLLPDNHRINPCIGFGADWNNLQVDLAYMFVYTLPRDVSDNKINPLPGTYYWTVHDVSISVGYDFDLAPFDKKDTATEPDPVLPTDPAPTEEQPVSSL